LNHQREVSILGKDVLFLAGPDRTRRCVCLVFVMAEAAAAAVIFIKARYHHAGMCHRMLSPLTVRTRRWQPCTLHLDSNSLPVCAAHAAGDSADLTTMRVGRDQLGQGKWQRVPNRIGFGHAQAELAAQAAALNAVVDAQVGHEPNL
jgi:hypothetical protein